MKHLGIEMEEPIYIALELTHREYAFVKGRIADYLFQENSKSETAINLLKKLGDDDESIKFLQDMSIRK